MITKSKNGLKWLQSELLLPFPEIKHGFFLRQGGNSPSPFASLNMGINRGDCFELVQKNRDKVKAAMALKTLFAANQVHGDSIIALDKKNVDSIGNFDSLMTNVEEIGLMVTHADCQAAIFFDPIQKAISTVHCGWRGNVCNIYKKTIHAMQRQYGSKPQNLLVAISPSLGPDFAEFINYRKEFPKEFWQFETTKDHFDLWALANWQLMQEQILPHHIDIARICTFSNPQEYFSYRRDKQITGVHGTLAYLQQFLLG